MAVIESVGPSRTRPRRRQPLSAQQLRRRIEALKPGAVFSIDRPITVEEFCEYVSDEGQAELIDGVIHIMVPPTDPHEMIAVWLLKVVGPYVEARGLGEVRGGRSGVLISSTTLREPDLLFFRKSRLNEMTERGVHGAPDLAVEIVESAKARREAVRKQIDYERIGVREYWVIDRPQREVRQWLLEDGRYELTRLAPDEELVSRTFEGFHIQVAWLFQGPSFPLSIDVVNALLKE
jgi:Uma2 family endonuclease